MKKFLLFLLAMKTFSSVAFAQEIDLLSGNIIENTDINSPQNTSDDSESTSWFGFITQPILNFFSSDEDVTIATEIKDKDGKIIKKESPLERSIRQAEEGNLEDQMNLAYMYLYGTNGVKQNLENAFKYYTLAAKQENPIALNNLGSLYFNGVGTAKDIKKALTLFQRASDLGNDNASINLAFIYLTGGTKNDERNKKAIELFEKAQKEGNKIAKFMVGYAHYIGFVVDRNYQTAFKLIRSAAGKDSYIDEAQIVLSQMYQFGQGTTQNYQKAYSALQAAMHQGNIDAMMKMAEYSENGTLNAPNLSRAHILYNIIAAQDIPEAAKKRDEIGKKLPPEQLIAAQNSANEYRPNPSELTSYIRQTYGSSLRHYIDINYEEKVTQQ